MAILNVNPTRAEMRVLMEKLQIASRGHTLLKEKQDSMIRRFMQMLEETRAQRHKVKIQLDTLFHMYQTSSIVTDDEVLQKTLHASATQLDVEVRLNEILGVSVPKYVYMEKGENSYISSVFLTPNSWDEIESIGNKISKDLVELAELEKRCFLFGQEIITTRRRVNALEFKTIPDLEETINSIKLKIEDSERNQIAKMLKLK